MTSGADTRRIIAGAARPYGVPVDVILSPARQKTVVAARHAAIRAVARKKPWLTLTQIGSIFGRDHTTVSYALGRINGKRPAG